MSDIKFHLVNYKLFENKEITLDDPEVIVISGPNEKGKTTIITALTEAWSLKGFTPDPLRKGTSSGHTAITGPDVNGNPITIIHDFNQFDRNGSFYAIDHTGKSIKSVAKIKELVGTFSPISLEEVYYMMKAADSRKRFIRDYIMPLIPKEVLEEIEEINGKVNETKGTLFLMRRQSNSDVKTYESLVSEQKPLTSEQLLALKNGELYGPAIIEIEKRIDTINQSNVENLKKQVAMDSMVTKVKDTHEKVVAAMKDIEYLNEQISAKKAFIEESKKAIDSMTLEVTKIVIEPFPTEEMADMKMDLERGKTALALYNATLATEASNKAIKDKLEDARLRSSVLDSQIADLRQKGKKLLEKAELPKGLSIDEDRIMLNELDLSDAQVSESAAKLALAELLCKLSTAKFIVMGNLGAFDSNRFKELVAIAQENNKIVVLESVVNTTDDIKVITHISDI